MDDVKLKLNEKGRGTFYILDGNDQIAEMEIGVSDNKLTAYHTEVFPKAEGMGLAKKLFASMVEYSRKNKLKVIALCPFVLAQFKRHPEEYADVWLRAAI
jgi:hypothetical protein